MKFLNMILFLFVSQLAFGQNESGASNQEIVTDFLEGFNDPAKIGNSLALLADDYHFKNPMVELQSKEEFIALAGEIGKVLTGLKILSIAENGEQVSVLYVFNSNIPGLESNVACEWFSLKNGKIISSHLIYDASKWREVYAQMEQ